MKNYTLYVQDNETGIYTILDKTLNEVLIERFIGTSEVKNLIVATDKDRYDVIIKDFDIYLEVEVYATNEVTMMSKMLFSKGDCWCFEVDFDGFYEMNSIRLDTPQDYEYNEEDYPNFWDEPYTGGLLAE